VPVAAGGGDAGDTTIVLTTGGKVTVAPVAVIPGTVTTDVTCAFAAYAANVIINAILFKSCIFQLSKDSEDWICVPDDEYGREKRRNSIEVRTGPRGSCK
jgi:hypothetical protein